MKKLRVILEASPTATAPAESRPCGTARERRNSSPPAPNASSVSKREWATVVRKRRTARLLRSLRTTRPRQRKLQARKPIQHEPRPRPHPRRSAQGTPRRRPRTRTHNPGQIQLAVLTQLKTLRLAIRPKDLGINLPETGFFVKSRRSQAQSRRKVLYDL